MTKAPRLIFDEYNQSLSFAPTSLWVFSAGLLVGRRAGLIVAVLPLLGIPIPTKTIVLIFSF